MRRAWMLGIAVAVLVVPPAALAAKGPALVVSEAGEAVPAGTEVGFSGTIQPQGRPGDGQIAGGGPLTANPGKSVRFTAMAAAAGGYQWKVEGRVSGVKLAAGGTAVVSTKQLAISPNPVPPPPPPVLEPPPRSFARKLQGECWYSLPSKLQGTFPLPGLLVVSAAGEAKPSKACTEPGFQATVTLTFDSEQLPGRPTLETALSG